MGTNYTLINTAWIGAGENGMVGKRIRIRYFRIAAVILSGLTVLAMSRFPAKAASIERQHQQLDEAAQAYFHAQSRNNQLNAELAQSDSDDFIERTARREYGYCWYGETVYEIGNLEELQAQEAADR